MVNQAISRNSGNPDFANLLLLDAEGNTAYPSRVFRKNEHIYRPGDKAGAVYFILSGRVKIGTYTSLGRAVTKAVLIKEEFFGELSLVGHSQRTNYAIAMEETRVGILSVEQMKQLMREDPGLSLHLMRIMGSRVIEIEQRLESLVFKNSRARVIEFLKNLVQKRGQRVGYEMLVRQFFTHQEIAHLTATSRQTVTTVLNELRNKNILTFNRRRLLVRDMDLLKAEAYC